jgi:hypothetical protein
MPRVWLRHGEPGPRRYHVSPGDDIDKHIVSEGKSCWCNAFLLYQPPASSDIAYEDEVVLHSAQPFPRAARPS